MTNLIPLASKKEVRMEYRVRLASVAMLVLAGVFLVVGALLIPTYQLLALQNEALRIEEQKQPQKGAVYDAHVESITRANTYITQLMNEPAQYHPSDIADRIIAADTDAIALHTIRYTDTSDGGDVSITGDADTRSDLVAFVESLKAEDMFRSATVPIADLAPERNLPFRLEIEIASRTETAS